MQTSKLRIETLTGPPITIPGAQISVRSQVVQLRFPTVNGGFIWNRPVATLVRTPDGQEEIIPILDITRIILFTLAGFCLTSIFILMFLRRKRYKS
jgi:hypothetical protein